ncbi:hypothetical protein E2562_017606 [Oryza meyeriana var. granulata]|uniref:TNase-like domain-containing protein n=1 Tax=Oryza meyeriana var. granulata TaxID=110450 RepID=A0A6G1BM06_9ORYZ|nr:hypothetical protein E2562_017606 [Oryza meyeriana var. granulata]
MGNILKCFISCFEEEHDGGGGSGYTPASRLYYQPLCLADLQVPLPPQLRPAPPLGYHHGVPWPTIDMAAQSHIFLDLEFTSTVCEEPRHHSTPSTKAHHNWCIDEKDGGSEPHYSQTSRTKNNHGVPVATSQTNLSPLAGHDALEHDLLNFEKTFRVPGGLAQHVTSSKDAQVTWYRKMLAAYKDMKSPPEASEDAAMLVATALRGIQRTNLEGVLAFYGFPIPTVPKEASDKHPSSIPKGVLFVLKTLPVKAKCIVDGDGFTADVDTGNPIEVREDFNACGQAPNTRKQKAKQKRANDLQMNLQNAGQKEMFSGGREILARQYPIRLRGIDAPEMGMQYGKESQAALVKLIAGKCVTLHVYEQDQYKRFVCDIYCDSVFIQVKQSHYIVTPIWLM